MQNYCFKKNLNEELAREYCQNEVTSCPVFDEGQEFMTGFEKPEGFCDWAWNDIHKICDGSPGRR